MIYDICLSTLAIVGTIGLATVIVFLAVYICLIIYYAIKDAVFKESE